MPVVLIANNSDTKIVGLSSLSKPAKTAIPLAALGGAVDPNTVFALDLSGPAQPGAGAHHTGQHRRTGAR